MQYSNFKDTLQNIASQIGNVEQEVEEHKYVVSISPLAFFLLFSFMCKPSAAYHQMQPRCLGIPIRPWDEQHEMPLSLRMLETETCRPPSWMNHMSV